MRLRDYDLKFWRKVNKGSDDQCWNWVGSKNNGYGFMYLPTLGNIQAHRISIALAKGVEVQELPTSDHVLHSCDNKACVNPNHLSLGSRSKNMLEMRERSDAYNKNRRRGEGLYEGYLTEKPEVIINESDVKKIRELSRTWSGMCDAMKEFGLSQAAVMEIIRRKSWKWVE